ncbi:IS607 family transposase [Persephonella sp.]
MKKYFSISEFAQLTGLSIPTIRYYIEKGIIKPYRTKGGHYRFDKSMAKQIFQYTVDGEKVAGKNVIYARVSTQKQKDLLNKQIQICKEFAIKNGYQIDEVITDIASSFNFNRKGLDKLIDMVIKEEVRHVIVYSKDRLSRIAFDLIEKIFSYHDCNIVVLDKTEKAHSKEEVEDLIEESVSFIYYITSKIYGKGRYKKSDIEKKVKEWIS